MRLLPYINARMRRFSQRRFWFIPIVVLCLLGFWFSLPEPLFNTPYSTILLDKNNHLLGAKISADEQWRFPEGNAVPERFKIAITTYEDRRFYRHVGVDPIAVLRAIYSNLANKRVVSGASTLTMQVIRLSKNNPSRTYWNKAKEALLAVRLEASYSKEEILTLYANHAPFGGNVVGIEAAAWRYFGRPAANLSWAETATLAVLPNQPSLIHLSRNRERLKQKRDELLADLYAQSRFDQIEYELALLEPLPAEPQPLPRLAPHLFDRLAQSNTGHRIETTLDAEIQASLTEVMDYQSELLLRKGIHNAALIAIDRDTMEVVAYIGNSRWQSTGDQGYALDLVQAKRSTGSILKPFLYAGMLQSGQILPSTLVEDRPSVFKGYRPENYDRLYRGIVPANEALTQSLNIPAVRMLLEYGTETFYDDLKTMGMTTLFRAPKDYGLPLILGGAEGTLWDISQMYANLAKASQANTLRPYVEPIQIMKPTGTTDASAEPLASQKTMPFGPGAAWLTLNALLDVKRPGLDHHWRQFSSSQNISWKTGTSYGLRDAWAIGNNGQYTVAVWAGNATGQGNAQLTGLQAAAPIMFDAFNRLGNHPWLSAPSRFLKTVIICEKDGYLANGKCASQPVNAPSDSYFEKATPFHKTIHLDATKRVRVHNQCERVSNMRSQNWFVLPPALEHFYQQSHDDYRPLPPYRSDCVNNSTSDDNPIGLIYPEANAEIYIPTDLDGNQSAIVFDAVHRNDNAIMYWHLDNHYLKQTRGFHQVGVTISPGWHTVTLVDETGNSVSRSFLVLGQ
ncbi:penicillin-binding protein 1C [Reinekea marinisedimentorum]|uniref:peptidoglycan glycosyltransferase n=1 Tax=Reinekea marinisedimentorum TaxID=230495 RepID=A0A4R3HUJ4_9GAMM|nr:penicillin-binding protein 1C [Reinekea marinisedimentorum]TCS36384.1 penicillin-binding protein 1C [Reinekea marinisedimentorum]